jgi:general secretion pathway protein J
VWFTLKLGRRAGHRDLVVTSTPELTDAALEPISKVLIPDVERITFAYFGKTRSEREAAWHDAWSGEPTLPQLVRLRVGHPPGSARSWPDLIIAPRVTADVGCVHDPLTKQCRGR